MKIKLFESFEIESDYEKIDLGKYRSLRNNVIIGALDKHWKTHRDNGLACEPFTTEEISKLNKMFNSEGKITSGIEEVGVCELTYYVSNSYKIITKIEDSWFLLKDIDYNESYYKCDGWVGLKKCLKHLKSKI